MHSLSVCVCPCLSETVYAHTLCILCDKLLFPDLQRKTASSLSWVAAPQVFLTQNIYLFHMTVIHTDIHHSRHVTVITRMTQSDAM